MERAQVWKNRIISALAADRVYVEQLEPIQRNGGLVLASNLALILIVGFSFLQAETARTASIWTSIGGLLGLLGLGLWWLSRYRPLRQRDATGVASKLAFFAGVRGFHWAAGFMLFMPHATPVLQTALGWALVGLLCGGAYAYNNLPKAAAAYVLPLSLGGTIAFMSSGHVVLGILSLALIGFCAVLITGAVSSTRLLQRAIEQQRQLGEQKDFVGILLRDFEDGATDWLFETGDGLTLQRGRTRLAQIFKVAEDEIAGTPFPDLLAARAGARDQKESVETLRTAFGADSAFSDLIVTFGSGASERFWKITAKPMAGMSSWRGVVSDVSSEQQSQRRVAHLALHDSLTGLSNRVFFRDKLTGALADLHNAEAERWAMFIDLDGFKGVNDTFGHHAGDKLLMTVARRLNAAIGEGDVLSRMGGDEFALLTSPIGAVAPDLADRLLKAFAEPINVNGHMVTVGASIGIVCLGRDGLTATDLLRHADLALYRAKAQGKGMWCMFSPDMDQALQMRLRTELELKDAITKNEFELHYQPIVSLATGETSGYEALLRWRHPSRGLVYPAEFISVAEEGGLITQIGEWVLSHAIAAASAWDDGLRVSINLAPPQIKSPRLAAAVLKALAETRIKPSRVEFEITETALLEETDSVLSTLKQLKTLGVRISLDDFGTGYSSLGYLHRFAFDNIKIDRSFVQAIETRKESAAVVKAVLGLAEDLGISTTAEGVETPEQLEAVKSRGCTEAQGYFLGKPAAESELMPGLRKRA